MAQTDNRRILHPAFAELLRRNGFAVRVVEATAGVALAVTGSDGVERTYAVPAGKEADLFGWRDDSRSAQRKAYETLAGLCVDYDFPKFVEFRNAGSRVNMTGRPLEPRGERPVRGHVPNRVPVYDRDVDVAGRIQSGRIEPKTAVDGDKLDQSLGVAKVVKGAPWVADNEIKYENISSDLYLTDKEQWLRCLSTHGLIVDETAGTLTVQSSSHRGSNMTYVLSDADLAVLTSPKNGQQLPIYDRLAVINNIIKDDYTERVTPAMLNTSKRIGIWLSDAGEQRLEEQKRQSLASADGLSKRESVAVKATPLSGDDWVNGAALSKISPNKAFYHSEADGRRMDVGNIWVEKTFGRYYMKADVFSDEGVHTVLSKEISEKDYVKFRNVDDMKRLRMADKKFDELSIKTVPGSRMSVGRTIGLVSAGILGIGAAVLDGRRLGDMPGRHDDFGRHTSVYAKLGVDSPGDVFERMYDAERAGGIRR